MFGSIPKFAHMKKGNYYRMENKTGLGNGILMLMLFCFPTLGTAQEMDAVNAATLQTAYVPTQPDSLFIYWKEKRLAYQQSGNTKGEAMSIQQMGEVLYQMGNYATAIEQLLVAEKMYRAQNDQEALATNINLLGTVYYYNQQPKLAASQFSEALRLFSLLKNDGGIAQTYAAIGHMYEKRKMYDSAFYYQQTALIYANKIGSIAAQAKIYENIGSIYEDRSQFDSAKFYFEKSLLLYQQNQDVLSSIEVINNLGDVYQKSGDYQRGLYYAKQAMLLAQQNKAMYQLQSAYRDMGQNFAMMQQHDSAYQYLEKSRALVQQIYAAENGQQIALQQTMYDTEKKNAEITRLQADKKVTSTIIVAAVLLLIVLSLLGIVAFSRQKLKIKNEQSINETNQKIFDTEKGLMESELQRQQLQEENLQQQLEIKSSQLSSHILHLIQKNEVMEEIKTGLTEIIHDDKRDQKKQLRQLLQKINFSFSQDSYWEQFRLIFDQVHTSFFTNLTQQFPSLTASELKLLSLIKMNLSTGDIATLLGITQDSLRVNRYRLKKKLGLEQGASLTAFIQAM